MQGQQTAGTLARMLLRLREGLSQGACLREPASGSLPQGACLREPVRKARQNMPRELLSCCSSTQHALQCYCLYLCLHSFLFPLCLFAIPSFISTLLPAVDHSGHRTHLGTLVAVALQLRASNPWCFGAVACFSAAA